MTPSALSPGINFLISSLARADARPCEPGSRLHQPGVVGTHCGSGPASRRAELPSRWMLHRVTAVLSGVVVTVFVLSALAQAPPKRRRRSTRSEAPRRHRAGAGAPTRPPSDPGLYKPPPEPAPEPRPGGRHRAPPPAPRRRPRAMRPPGGGDAAALPRSRPTTSPRSKACAASLPPVQRRRPWRLGVRGGAGLGFRARAGYTLPPLSRLPRRDGSSITSVRPRRAPTRTSSTPAARLATSSRSALSSFAPTSARAPLFLRTSRRRPRPSPGSTSPSGPASPLRTRSRRTSSIGADAPVTSLFELGTRCSAVFQDGRRALLKRAFAEPPARALSEGFAASARTPSGYWYGSPVAPSPPRRPHAADVVPLPPRVARPPVRSERGRPRRLRQGLFARIRRGVPRAPRRRHARHREPRRRRARRPAPRHRRLELGEPRLPRREPQRSLGCRLERRLGHDVERPLPLRRERLVDRQHHRRERYLGRLVRPPTSGPSRRSWARRSARPLSPAGPCSTTTADRGRPSPVKRGPACVWGADRTERVGSRRTRCAAALRWDGRAWERHLRCRSAIPVSLSHPERAASDVLELGPPPPSPRAAAGDPHLAEDVVAHFDGTAWSILYESPDLALDIMAPTPASCDVDAGLPRPGDDRHRSPKPRTTRSKASSPRGAFGTPARATPGPPSGPACSTGTDARGRPSTSSSARARP